MLQNKIYNSREVGEFFLKQQKIKNKRETERKSEK